MYKGRENYETVKHLMTGEECIVAGYGQSMTPILKSGQSVRCIPVTEETVLKKNDIVLCKVAGHFYLHKISAVNLSDRYFRKRKISAEPPKLSNDNTF